MSAKRILCILSAGTMLAAAAPAFADQPHWARAHGFRHNPHNVVVVKHHHRPVVREVFVRRTVVVERPVYIGQPAIVVHQPPAYYSAPVYAAPVYDPVLGTLGGAIIGAAIGSQIGRGDGRTAAIAVGAVLGGALGSGR